MNNERLSDLIEVERREEKTIIPEWKDVSIELANSIKDGVSPITEISYRPLTSTYNLMFNRQDKIVVLKTESLNGFNEINNNCIGYDGMPETLRPNILDTGIYNNNIHYLLMEHSGKSLKEILSGSLEAANIQSLHTTLLESFLNSSSYNPEEVRFLWDNLMSTKPEGFSFGLMIERIERKHGFDTTRIKAMIDNLHDIVIAKNLLPGISHWSAGDLTANHIFNDGQRWIVIDPKKISKGIPEIDLGRLSAQIDMYTGKWSETFNEQTELGNVIPDDNANLTMTVLKDLSSSIRNESHIDSSFYFNIGVIWQNIIAIQARSGEKMRPLFLETEKMIENLIHEASGKSLDIQSVNILNKNIKKESGEFFIKKSYKEKGTLSEYRTLEYFSENIKLKVPSPVSYEQDEKTIKMPNIRGILLIDLMRRMSEFSKRNSLPAEMVDEVNTTLLQKMTIDLTTFQNHSDKILTFLPKEIIEIYPYKQHLVESLEMIAKYCNIRESNIPKQEAERMGVKLEEKSVTAHRDAGLYNQLIEIPNGVDIEPWIKKLFSDKPDVSKISDLIYQNLFHIDFETCYRLVCPEDDQSFILSSSVNKKLELVPENQKNNEVYYSACLFRNIRTASRHIQYLIEAPDVYTSRYKHYGSIKDELPSNYLNTVLKIFEKMTKNGIECEYSIYDFVRSAILVLKPLENSYLEKYDK